jgi:hypothetical protein
MSAAERKELARKAALARWAKKRASNTKALQSTPSGTHRRNGLLPPVTVPVAAPQGSGQTAQRRAS